MSSVFFKEAWQKAKEEHNPLGRPNKRKSLRELPQKGKSNYERDVVKKALVSGKRVSKTGHTYWESRKNRSDKSDSMV